MYEMTRADITAQLGFFEDTARKDDAERFLSKAERKRLEADIADHRKWLEPYVDQYWKTSDPDHPLVMINWAYDKDPKGFCPAGSVVVYNGHNRWAMKREHLLEPAGQGPIDVIVTARILLDSREPCCDECAGWAVFSGAAHGEHGLEIQRCDACYPVPWHGIEATDEHFIALPEAQAALAKEHKEAT